MQSVVFRTVRAGRIPHRSDFHFLIAYGDLGRLTALLLYIRFDDLRSNASGKLSVLSTLEQYGHDDLGISSRSYAHKPGIVFVFRLAIGGLGLERVADRLRASCLAREIDPLQMRAARRAHWRR